MRVEGYPIGPFWKVLSHPWWLPPVPVRVVSDRIAAEDPSGDPLLAFVRPWGVRAPLLPYSRPSGPRDLQAPSASPLALIPETLQPVRRARRGPFLAPPSGGAPALPREPTVSCASPPALVSCILSSAPVVSGTAVNLVPVTPTGPKQDIFELHLCRVCWQFILLLSSSLCHGNKAVYYFIC